MPLTPQSRVYEDKLARSQKKAKMRGEMVKSRFKGNTKPVSSFSKPAPEQQNNNFNSYGNINSTDMLGMGLDYFGNKVLLPAIEKAQGDISEISNIGKSAQGTLFGGLAIGSLASPSGKSKAIETATKKLSTVKLPRGRFETARKGLSALSEIITGDPKQTSFVMQNYPTQGRLAARGQASFRGIDDEAASQVKHFAATGRSGFERAGNWLDIKFPQLGHLIDETEASVNDLSRAGRGAPISFGSAVPSVDAVKRALDIRRADLGPLSSSFGFVNNPAARYGRTNVTAGKEHIAGSAYQGANIVGQTLKAARETSQLDEVLPLIDKLEKNGRAALNPDELILVDAFFNSGVKGTLPYEIAREKGLELGQFPLIRQLGDEAKTHGAYTDFLYRMSNISEDLVDPLRMEFFAKTIKPKVKFGENAWGAAKDAFDPSDALASTRQQLAEFLMKM